MNAVLEALDQVREGMDFTPAAKLLGRLSAEDATAKPAGWPYSIAENVAHAEYWQRLWLARFRGEKRPKVDRARWDWPLVAPEEWPQVRDAWTEGMRDASELAAAEPFQHAMTSEYVAMRTLLQIAVHNAYHVGQVKLMKRLLRACRD